MNSALEMRMSQRHSFKRLEIGKAAATFMACGLTLSA